MKPNKPKRAKGREPVAKPIAYVMFRYDHLPENLTANLAYAKMMAAPQEHEPVFVIPQSRYNEAVEIAAEVACYYASASWDSERDRERFRRVAKEAFLALGITPPTAAETKAEKAGGV